MTQQSASDFDVAIVGYGPVGAFSALLLAEAGLQVALLERGREIVQLPRAVGLDGESLRAFQRIGLGEAVNRVVQPPREAERVCFTDSKRNEIFGQEIPQYGWNGWRDILFFDQPELEALLREQVEQSDRITTFLGHELEQVSQDENEVVLRGRRGHDEELGSFEVRAPFVVASDGASSTVRERLGIEWQSLGYDQDWLVIDILQKPEARLPLETMQVCDPERLTTYVCVKDPNRRWEFQLRPGETREQMLRPETIQGLLDPWLPPEHYELRRAAVYQFHAATAARWHEGRVFLAGDAAHQTPPFLGQGLNAGFRDAVNLGWKIPLVLAGICGQKLLDSYGAERDAHARDLVEGAIGIGKLMETLAAREAGRPDPHADSPPRVGFGPGRGAPSLRGGALVEEQCEGAAGKQARAGVLLRQPTLRDSEGHEFRLDERLGRSFGLVARKQSDLQMGREARAIFERIGGRATSLEGLEVRDGELDELFEEHPAALLRPDRYIFGVVDDDWDLDRLVLELGRRLELAS